MKISKMIYVMNVDWNWIKQRPHFIAEGLAEKFDITVMYQYRYNRSGFQKRKTNKVNIKPIYVIPRIDRYKRFKALNNYIKVNYIQSQIKQKNAKYLYLTFPDQVEVITRNQDIVVIYDCMDNHPAFINDMECRIEMEQQEALLVERANIVFVSSEKLREVLLLRYGNQYSNKIFLVRNGYSGEICENTNAIKKINDGQLCIAYFGTISNWFNFEFLEKSIKEIPNIKYLLIGPIAGVKVPEVKGIEYLGTVEHKDLQKATEEVDCFIMPFIVNEIIESVDPVKLYEYINFNKNILCVKYREIERFNSFVHFYSDYDSFINQIKHLKKCVDNKYSTYERKTFLLENSWSYRIEKICQILNFERNDN